MGNYDKPFEVLKLTESYIPALLEMAETYFTEANWKENGIDVDTKAFEHLLKDHLSNPYCCALIAVHEGKVIGYALGYCQADYTKQLIGELFQFSVAPDWRGTNVARCLVSALVEQYKEWGCKRCYAEASSGIPDPRNLRHFANLWGKFGYKEIGTVIMLDL